jgi:hypothetical protein
MLFLDGSRGLRCAPTPGYLLQPLRGKELLLFFKKHNRAEQSLLVSGFQIADIVFSNWQLATGNWQLNYVTAS